MHAGGNPGEQDGAGSLSRRSSGMSLLEARSLNTYYGDSHILFDVSLRVERNEVVALLGRNGAGKSTTLKSLMGVVRPRSGSVIFDDADVTGKPSHAIALAGMHRVHEGRTEERRVGKEWVGTGR